MGGVGFLARLRSGAASEAVAGVTERLKTIALGRSDKDAWERYEQMAAVARTLDVRDYQLLVATLGTWLDEDAEEWRTDAAVGLAAVLRDEPLLRRAIDEARRRGVGDDDLPTGVVPRWLVYQSELLVAITRFATPVGLEYLRELRGQARGATSRARRRLAISAWLRLCYLESGVHEPDCVAEALRCVRRWDDPRLTGMVEGTLLGLYRGDRSAILRTLLTPSEYKRVMRFARR
jgi:hypothetical protein